MVRISLFKRKGMKKTFFVIVVSAAFVVVTGFTACVKSKQEAAEAKAADFNPVADIPEPVVADTLPKLTVYKKNAVATYYADKFNGRKTSSGERFDNTKYTAAHMKLPFGTMVRVTNEANGKWVDVKVNDRGPYSKKLEIDLTKKAFMEIASKKGSGTFKVTIEIIEPQD